MRPEDRRVVAVLGFLHGAVHANVLAIPVFLNLAWRPEFRADNLTLGLLAAIAYAGFGIGSVPFGFLADRKPPTSLLVLCAGGIAASLGAVAVSPSLPFLGVALGALGLFSGIYHPTGLSAISRSVAEQGRGMGWHGMGGSLGIALGPAFVGAALGLGWSWRAVAALMAFPPLLGAIRLLARPLTFAGSTASADKPRLRSLATASFGLILLVYLFAGLAYQGSLTFLPQFIGAGPFAIALGLGAIGQVLSGTLADRPRPHRLLCGLSVAAASLLLMVAVAPNSTSFLFGALAFGFLLFSLEPLQNTLVAHAVPRPLRGVAFGLTFLSVFGIGSIGAVLAGLFLSRGEASLLFALLGAFLVLSGACAVGARRAGLDGR